MKTLTGELLELYIENGTTIGRVKISDSVTRVPMFFILDAKAGDTVLIESGVAISIYKHEEETEYVLSNTGQSFLN